MRRQSTKRVYRKNLYPVRHKPRRYPTVILRRPNQHRTLSHSLKLLPRQRAKRRRSLKRSCRKSLRPTVSRPPRNRRRKQSRIRRPLPCRRVTPRRSPKRSCRKSLRPTASRRLQNLRRKRNPTRRLLLHRRVIRRRSRKRLYRESRFHGHPKRRLRPIATPSRCRKRSRHHRLLLR